MTRTVWKYPLPVLDGEPFPLVFPCGVPGNLFSHPQVSLGSPVVLHLDFQEGSGACLWVEVDPQAKAEVWLECRWFGTGHPIPDGFDYLGTLQFHGGALVGHLYARPAPEARDAQE